LEAPINISPVEHSPYPHYYERFTVPGSDDLEVQVATYTDMVCMTLFNWNTGLVLSHVDVPHQLGQPDEG
jgi:hypothetical protein